MSAHSTLCVSRGVAREAIFRMLYNMSDEQMRRILDRELDDRLYNVLIVESGEDDEHFQRVTA